MRKLLIIPLIILAVGCTSVERQAYNTVVAAKAFLDTTKSQHQECYSIQSELCVDLSRATSAKDLLIDAIEVYCAGPQFQSGGACNSPAKGTSAYAQATDKLTAALAAYNRSEQDLKGALLK